MTPESVGTEPVTFIAHISEREWCYVMAAVTAMSLAFADTSVDNEIETLYQKLLGAGALAGFQIDKEML